MKKLILFKDWINLYIALRKNPLSALMFCKYRKYENEVIIVNTEEIPEDLTCQDIVDLCNGKFIKV